MNNRAQMFPALIVLFLVVLIFIFASPMLFSIINTASAGQGSFTAFIMKLFLWVIFITLLALGIKIVTSGEGMFA